MQYTLSLVQRKGIRYQTYLNLSNVFLLIASTILIFLAIILMRFYHVDKLDVWDNLFWIVPIYMICLGVFTFLVCIFGLLISGSDNRPLILVYAPCCSLFGAIGIHTHGFRIENDCGRIKIQRWSLET